MISNYLPSSLLICSSISSNLLLLYFATLFFQLLCYSTLFSSSLHFLNLLSFSLGSFFFCQLLSRSHDHYYISIAWLLISCLFIYFFFLGFYLVFCFQDILVITSFYLNINLSFYILGSLIFFISFWSRRQWANIDGILWGAAAHSLRLPRLCY